MMMINIFVNLSIPNHTQKLLTGYFRVGNDMVFPCLNDHLGVEMKGQKIKGSVFINILKAK